MNMTLHFQSLSQECAALKDRVQNLIADRHWATVGESRESVVRMMLRRHLPAPFEVGRGFVLSPTQVSTQVDVLIYDGSVPILFKEGDLVIVSRGAFKAMIEVKSRLDPTLAAEAIAKLSEEARKFELPCRAGKLFALFAFEWEGGRTTHIDETLQASADGNINSVIDLVALGPDTFVKWWCSSPPGMNPRKEWHLYDLQGAAFGYFLHNVIVETCRAQLGADEAMWFPPEGKEQHLVRTIPLDVPRAQG